LFEFYLFIYFLQPAVFLKNQCFIGYL